MQDDIFIKVYKEYMPYVYRYLYGLTCSRHTSEDLTQETFIKALCILQSPNNSIKSWLLTVAHNLYIDYIRKNKKLELHGDSIPEKFVFDDFTNDILLKEKTKAAFKLIRQLPESQRQAVLLCLVNELSYEQAGKILGVSVSAVTNLIYRARKTLRYLRRDIE